VDSHGQSHLSYIVQLDRTDSKNLVGQSGKVDSHGQSHLSCMVQWDRTDSRIWWARVREWIPMDSPIPVPWYSGIGQTVEYGRTGDTHGLYHLSQVQWDFLLCKMDSDGKFGHPSREMPTCRS